MSDKTMFKRESNAVLPQPIGKRRSVSGLFAWYVKLNVSKFDQLLALEQQLAFDFGFVSAQKVWEQYYLTCALGR